MATSAVSSPFAGSTWLFTTCFGVKNHPPTLACLDVREPIPCPAANAIGSRNLQRVWTPFLSEVYFEGNAPSIDLSTFNGDNAATIYYLPGTTGWGPTIGGRPTALWKPLVQANDASFGVRTNQFGFSINWASGRVVVVEACTDLTQPIWSPVGTNTLTDGSSYFSDPQWTNHPARFYRLRSP